MKWINLLNFIKKICILYLDEVVTTTVILHRSKKYQEVKEKKQDFEMSVPSCRMCLHHNGSLHRSTN